MLQSPATRVVLAVLGWSLLPVSEPKAPAAPAAPTTVALTALNTSGSLARGYQLPLADVPPPPPSSQPGGAATFAPAAPPPTACPFEVRAIVMAEDPADSFAMVGHDGESHLLRAGAGVRLGGELLSVATLSADAVVVRRGEATVRCPLAD